jgi:hypothetical protein
VSTRESAPCSIEAGRFRGIVHHTGMKRGAWIVGVALGAAASGAPARGAGADLVEIFESAGEQVALVELFTSEGCSSCPPAEARMGTWRERDGLWTRFVPVAFHVDYWDRLGWRDRFASREFAGRQRAIARTWRSGSVYTPCFVRNGAEWSGRDPETGLRRANAGRIRLTRETGGGVRIEFSPGEADAGNEFDAWVVLLGGGIASDVKAGENRGRRLEHEFVVVAQAVVALTKPVDETTLHAGRATGLVYPNPLPERTAIAGWVSRRGEVAPIQSVGGWTNP